MDTILIVEDDEALNDGIAIGLGQREYRLIQAYTKAQGETALKEGGIDLCIFDVNLPVVLIFAANCGKAVTYP